MTSALPKAHIPGFPAWTLSDRLKERAHAVLEQDLARLGSDAAVSASKARAALVERGNPVPLALETLDAWRQQALSDVSGLSSYLQEGYERAPWLYPPSRIALLERLRTLTRFLEAAPPPDSESSVDALSVWRRWCQSRSTALDPRVDASPVIAGWLSGCPLMIDYENNVVSCGVNWLQFDLPDEHGLRQS